MVSTLLLFCFGTCTSTDVHKYRFASDCKVCSVQLLPRLWSWMTHRHRHRHIQLPVTCFHLPLYLHPLPTSLPRHLAALTSTCDIDLHLVHVNKYPLVSALSCSCVTKGLYCSAVALLSLQAQIQGGATSHKPVQMLQYGPEGPVDPTKCTAVCFIPGSEGTVFAAAHLSGTVIIHIKVCLLKQQYRHL